MLPTVTAADVDMVLEEAGGDVPAYAARLMARVRADNPEVGAYVALATARSADPSGVLLAGLLVYRLLEAAALRGP